MTLMVRDSCPDIHECGYSQSSSNHYFKHKQNIRFPPVTPAEPAPDMIWGPESRRPTNPLNLKTLLDPGPSPGWRLWWIQDPCKCPVTWAFQRSAYRYLSVTSNTMIGILEIFITVTSNQFWILLNAAKNIQSQYFFSESKLPLKLYIIINNYLNW